MDDRKEENRRDEAKKSASDKNRHDAQTDAINRQ